MGLALLGDLADLVLPSACAGCGGERLRLTYGVCAACAATLEALRPFRTAPSPPPSGMPRCVAAGAYEGELRGVLLAFKERGRHRLGRPLGALLATAVASVAPRDRPVCLVPVPSTAAAARERNGDHMARMAGHAVRRLRAAGWDARVGRILQASPRPDSVSLTVAERAAAAESSLRIRPRRIAFPHHGRSREGTLVVVDDIVTTGATLAAVTRRLEEANMLVAGAAVLAATRLRRASPAPGPVRRPGVSKGRKVPDSVSRTRGDAGASAR